jgi:hypothetical protein
MPDRTPRFSRRKLIQFGSLAPLAALAASGASIADVAAAAQGMSKVPDPAMKELLKKAKKRREDTGKQYDEGHTKNVAEILWAYFMAGPNEYDVAVPDEAAVIAAAYIMPTNDQNPPHSGDKIVDHIDDWDKQTLHMPLTNTCAGRVGIRAACIAIEEQKTAPFSIDVEIFKTAWMEIALEMQKCFGRLVAQNPGRKPRILGAGC